MHGAGVPLVPASPPQPAAPAAVQVATTFSSSLAARTAQPSRAGRRSSVVVRAEGTDLAKVRPCPRRPEAFRAVHASPGEPGPMAARRRRRLEPSTPTALPPAALRGTRPPRLKPGRLSRRRLSVWPRWAACTRTSPAARPCPTWMAPSPVVRPLLPLLPLTLAVACAAAAPVGWNAAACSTLEQDSLLKQPCR